MIKESIQSPAKLEPSPSHEELGRRRPMKVRQVSLCTRLASILNGAGVTPNQVSVVGLGVGLGIGVVLALTAHVPGTAAERFCWAGVIFLMLLRGACNILDGVIAVECGQSTPVGHLYNEIPDRISDIAMLVGAGYATGGNVELGWAAAVVALFVAYTRVQVDVAGARQSFIGPAAKPARVVIIAGAAIFHLVAPGMAERCTESSGGSGPISWALGVIIIGGVITIVRRLVVASRELRKNRAAV